MRYYWADICRSGRSSASEIGAGAVPCLARHAWGIGAPAPGAGAGNFLWDRGSCAIEGARGGTDRVQLEIKFMRKLTFVSAGLMLAVVAAPAARAQVTIDVAKITCEQFILYKVASPQNIAIWLSGYYSGKRGNTLVDTQDLKEKSDKVMDYCRANLNTPLMQAVETLFSPNK
jgi:hypothetical protein